MQDGEQRLATRTFFVLLAAGLIVRIALTATSLGSNDAVAKIMWAHLTERYGVAGAYAHDRGLNHPPLAVLLFHLLDLASRKAGIEYTDLIRHLQSAADLLTAGALVAIGRLRNIDGRRLALLFFLSPAAIAISAFHCNTDATMVAFVTCAALFAVKRRPALAALFLGLATGIKIVPLFVLPFFLLAMTAWRERLRFAAVFGATIAAIFVPPLLIAGPAVLTNVFGYNAFAGKWGLTALLLTARGHASPPLADTLFRAALWYANDGKYLLLAALVAAFLLIAWRVRLWSTEQRTPMLLAAIPIVYLLALFLAPGFGVQYLDWPLPLLLFALPRRWTVAVFGAFSAYLAFTYTIWSGGFPWWYADSIAPSPLKPWVTIAGLPVWIVCGVAALVALSPFVRSAVRSA